MDGAIISGIIVECTDAELQNAVNDVIDSSVRLSAVGCFLAVPPEWEIRT